MTQEEYNSAILKLSYNGFDDVIEIIDTQQKDLEISRKAAHLFEDASNIWMERAIKAETELLRLQETISAHNL